MAQPVGPPFPEPTRRSVVDQLVDSIAGVLFDGQLVPGSVLPPERELAASMNVNRTSLRHALGRLEQIGLVKTLQGIGTVVCDPADSTDAAVLGLLASRGGADLVSDALGVRQALCPLVARLAATRAAATDRERLHLALSALEHAGGAAQTQRAEAAFFDVVIDATHSATLRFLWNAMNAVYRSAFDVFEDAYADHDFVCRALGTIATLILAADADGAAEAMIGYSADNAQRMLAAFDATR